jgi:hypothetical protein
MRPDTVPRRRLALTGESSLAVIADVRSRKAARSGGLAPQGHPLRSLAEPPGVSRQPGLLRAQDPGRDANDADVAVAGRLDTGRNHTADPLPSNPALAAL